MLQFRLGWGGFKYMCELAIGQPGQAVARAEESESPLDQDVPWVKFAWPQRPGRAQPIDGSEIVGAQTVVLQAVTGDHHASAKLSGAQPNEWTIRRRHVRAVEVVDERLWREQPRSATRLDRLPPSIKGINGGLPKKPEHRAASQPA